MKITIKIILLFITSLFLSCSNSKTEEKKHQNFKTKTIKCEDSSSKIPRRIDELTTKVPLNINLNDDCNFQLIHIQIKDNQPSTEVVARFKKEGNTITQIEFIAFEIIKNPRGLLVKNVRVGKRTKNTLFLTFDLVLNNLEGVIHKYNNKIELKNAKFIDFAVNDFIVYKDYDDMNPRVKHCGARIY